MLSILNLKFVYFQTWEDNRFIWVNISNHSFYKEIFLFLIKLNFKEPTEYDNVTEITVSSITKIQLYCFNLQ
jgi:hypothetical protein